MDAERLFPVERGRRSGGGDWGRADSLRTDRRPRCDGRCGCARRDGCCVQRLPCTARSRARFRAMGACRRAASQRVGPSEGVMMCGAGPTRSSESATSSALLSGMAPAEGRLVGPASRRARTSGRRSTAGCAPAGSRGIRHSGSVPRRVCASVGDVLRGFLGGRAQRFAVHFASRLTGRSGHVSVLARWSGTPWSAFRGGCPGVNRCSPTRHP
jgi:hypothetical protein